ncbi:MAG: hypothetical protein LQ342_003800 [Letrouitia transgressa]|nr:MAG: hypothetical protein LQ342_003800 [Letrouitia transgressa]
MKPWGADFIKQKMLLAGSNPRHIGGLETMPNWSYFKPHHSASHTRMPSPGPDASAQTQSTYEEVITALTLSPHTVLEIDILPAAYSPVLFHAHPSIGLPRSLLKSCFITARSIFFSYLNRPDPHDPETADLEHRKAAFQATLIILLFDPNHLTAVNFRKRHLLFLKDRDLATENRLQEAVDFEKLILQSLVTSPLGRHAKSSTLWAHRVWLFSTFFAESIGWEVGIAREEDPKGPEIMKRFLETELAIVMKAGERHARNYYAWDYARQLFGLFSKKGDFCESNISKEEWITSTRVMSITTVHKWCLVHPRDISGWAFLTFLIGQDVQSPGSKRTEGKEGDRDQDMSENIIRITKEFIRKFKLRGESVEWFLKVITDDS